ncbi:MAG: hypothetical protein PUF72_10005 [Clostridiales bacterium]|nr:hypothetical protein [Clostridiales bacterium]
METIKQRLKSPIVWTAIIAQAVIIAGVFCEGLGDNIKIIGAAAVEILTVLGILNNPTDSEKF